jgi:hypothetical protein
MIKTQIKRDVFLLEGICKNTKILKSLKNKIKDNTKNLEAGTTNVKAKTTSFIFLRKDPDFITFLKDIRQDINKVYPYDFIVIDAWGNAYEKGQYAVEHTHIGSSAFCGILYLSNNGPGTYFSELDLTVKEKEGKFVLFSPILKHSVNKHKDKKQRITAAFNMDECKPWIRYNENPEYAYV